MKLNSAMSKFLTNKWVLNIVAFLALFNVMGYIVMGNLNSVLYFIVIAVLIRYFSKNMTIVLGVPLIIVNLLSIRHGLFEGMESGTVNLENKQEEINKMVKKNNSNNSSAVIDGPVTDTPDAVAESDTNTDNAAQTTGGEQQGFESGRRKNKGNNIDKPATIEDAYDEVNNILGSDGISKTN
jgi:hypothetical protein